jgi:hypothetical protein
MPSESNSVYTIGFTREFEMIHLVWAVAST